MTKAPTIPRSNRNLADLDALIDQSLGTQTIDTAIVTSKAKTDENNTAKAPPMVSPISNDPASEVEAGEEPTSARLERLQVKISDDVLLAMKFEALRQKRSPSAIVELALRQYLNLLDDA
ncbi:CopG family transcriptional regulator [Rhizobium sp. C4]|uniref:ribbon-helix-helix domain-containing protein n=1 Tax=Rhizobium sp. C4 TaxID=1349800 RepID=UPI001E4129C3|nr:CopG family transcriptional regulator [Rhizobium sp. C4]MCD2174921.1 ribbon-helix-helix domain-containing protein [Rhizobium sp. C4]